MKTKEELISTMFLEAMFADTKKIFAETIENHKKERFEAQILAIEAKHADKPKKKREKHILKDITKTLYANIGRDIDERNDAREIFSNCLASLYQAPSQETRIHNMEDISHKDFQAMSDDDLFKRIKGR